VHLSACRNSQAAPEKFKEVSMQKVVFIAGALVIGGALASSAVLAQNLQGPSAPNYGVNSGPWSGGMPNDGPSADSTKPLSTYASGNRSGRGQPRIKHVKGSHKN
jgi:hypothetical protein